MFERFTDRSRKVMAYANQEAIRFNHEYIGTEHILLGLVKEGRGVGANVLKRLNVDLRKVRLEAEKLVKPGPELVAMSKLPRTRTAKNVLKYAVEEARYLEHKYVGTEHLLLGLLREKDGIAGLVLINIGLDLDNVREEVLKLIGAGVESELSQSSGKQSRIGSGTTKATFSIFRGEQAKGNFVDYTTEVSEGMVVLDAVHQIQATQANDLACRWNCKAGKCGSCSAEINGKPRLMCMTRLNDLDLNQPVTIEPMHAFPHVRDLVTDVSWNFRVKKQIKPFKPRKPDNADGTWKMAQEDVDRVQEFRKCIECFLCQDVCHVLRDHQLHDQFIGPRFFVYTAALEMHPLDTEDRLPELKQAHGVGYCNITKCCTKVCPEHIHITDNAIIPLKERVVDRYYDPVKKLFRIFGK